VTGIAGAGAVALDRASSVDLAVVAAGFGRRLHDAGVPVAPERSGWFARTITIARPSTRNDLYWLARATLVTRHDQIGTFDAVFAEIFRGIVDVAERGDPNSRLPPLLGVVPGGGPRAPGRSQDGAGTDRPRAPGPTVGDTDGDRDGPEHETVLAERSDTEHLGAKDFGVCTPDELATLQSLIAALIPAPPRRPSRRLVRRRRGDRIDLRSTLRRAQRTGGDPVRQVRRRRTDRPRRVVLLADVSGSMHAYSRAYLYLLHGAVRAVRAEAFLFATRLTRVSRQLRTSSPEVALGKAVRAAEDFAGGTRIGEVLKAFNDGWGRRGLARGAVVVIVSDGWDGGDPELVALQMERLARLAHRIVWVNPRKAAAGYEPTVAAMRAALPYVEVFVSGHSFDAMVEVVAALDDDVVGSRRRPASRR